MTGGFQRPQPSVVTFTLFLVHSVLGVVRFGNPQYGDALRLVYENTGFLCIVVALPCFTVQIGMMYGIPIMFMTPMIFLALTVAVWHYISRFYGNVKSNGGEARWSKSRPVSFVVVVSLSFVSILSYQKQNYYGLAAALAYFHNFFMTGPTGTAFNHPAIDLFLYQLTFFNAFAVKALLD